MSTVAPPGVNVLIRDTPSRSGPPTGTGRWFVGGIAMRGPTAPHRVSSIGQYQQIYGARESDSPLYDALDYYFRRGGTEAWVSRVTGPNPVNASLTLNDSMSAPALTVDANSPGSWGDLLEVQVVAGTGGGFILVVTNGGVEVERSPELADNAAAAAWSTTSGYVLVTVAGSNQPAPAAAAALTGGTDDRAAATDTQWQEALDRFDRDLGAGQVSFPGRTTTAAHTQLADHGDDRNRCALLDFVHTGNVSTLTTAAAAIRNLGSSRDALAFGPWGTIPGVAGIEYRLVPPSAIAAALIAVGDATWGDGQAPAGDFGVADGVVAFEYQFTDDERATLNDAGVNVFRMVHGVPKLYGFRTLAHPTAQPVWKFGTAKRVTMALKNESAVIGERFVFAPATRQVLGEYGAAIALNLKRRFDMGRGGGLWGAEPLEAYSVDVGPGVNPDADLEAGRIRCVAVIKLAPTAEQVIVELVPLSIQEAV